MDETSAGRLRGFISRTPRLLVYITVFLLVLVVILYGTTRLITTGTFTEIETRDVEEGVRRAEAAFDNLLSTQARTAKDYAEWDDAFDFAEGTYPTFLEENVIPDSMENLEIDFMAVVREGAAPDEGRSLSVTGELIDLPTYLMQELASNGLRAAYDPVATAGQGVLLTEEGAVLFATNPITSTDGERKAPAFLAVGRLLNDEVVSETERMSRLPLEVQPTSAAADLPPSARALLAESPSGVAVVPKGEGEVRGSAFIEAVDGEPAFLLTVSMPRTARFIGDRALTLLRYALLGFGIVACLAVAHVFNLQHREVMRRKQAEEAVRVSEKRHRALIEQMADAVFGLSAEGTITLVNTQAIKLTGRDEEWLLGRPASALMTPEGWERAQKRLEIEVLTGTSESIEVDIVHVSGRIVPVEINSSPMVDDDGSIAGAQWIARDVTDRRRFEQELVFLANQDYLTGLYNRRRFEEELLRQMGRAGRTGRQGALLWLDIDFFKDINDSLGHQAGDQVLVGVAATARTHLRADNILARLGGDEFAVLIPEADRAQAEECAERLVSAIRDATYMFEERELRVTTSMGIVVFPDHGATIEELLARADLAMYRAKDEGRNRFCVYEPGENWHAEQRLHFDWVAQIDKALREDLFVVYAQPVVSLADGLVDRHELLIRMEGADGDILLPSAFLPTAERSGLIHQIDQWMVRRAIDLISMNAGRDASYRLDVNLSGRAFSDTELLRVIESELIRTGIHPASFGVEVTETAAVSDMGKARQFITALRNMGCRVSLDDFGSGFSSFYYLKNLPIDCLKIDGSFVQNICTNLQDQHVVKAMVELSQGFGVDSTAEYVEDEATLELLRSFGVTYAQGFHIARPVPVSEIERSPDGPAPDGGVS